MREILPGHPSETLTPIARQITTRDLLLLRRGETSEYRLIIRIEESGRPPIVEVATLDAAEAIHCFFRLPQKMAEAGTAFPTFRAVLTGSAPPV